MEECRVRSKEVMALGKPVNRLAAAVIIAIWISLAALSAFLLARIFLH
jgi:hypothetical protein